MAKKKTTKEQVVEPVIEETATASTEALPEITEDNVNEVKESVTDEAPVEKKTKKRTTKKKVEVPAEEVIAVDNDGTTTPLTDIVPETKGETVVAEVEVAEEAPVEEAPVEEAPVKKKPAKKSTKPTTKKPTAKVEKKESNGISIKKPVWCYPNAVAPRAIKTISGIVYLWDKTPSKGRYAVTDKPDGAGKLSAICGWVKAEDLGL